MTSALARIGGKHCLYQDAEGCSVCRIGPDCIIRVPMYSTDERATRRSFDDEIRQHWQPNVHRHEEVCRAPLVGFVSFSLSFSFLSNPSTHESSPPEDDRCATAMHATCQSAKDAMQVQKVNGTSQRVRQPARRNQGNYLGSLRRLVVLRLLDLGGALLKDGELDALTLGKRHLGVYMRDIKCET